MAFGIQKLRKQLPKKNMITLTCITDGYKYDFLYNPQVGVSAGLRRTLDEFDEQGFPLFFADKQIEGVPVRVRSSEIEARMAQYIQSRHEKKMMSKSIDQSQTAAASKISNEEKKIRNKKAARSVKPKTAQPQAEA
ncbi:MAG TPA: hypothetical protein DCW74_01060 [Alteromonas australica]|uniref:Uncharacterized protein n=1 Tax=Alteromonas australica TaxID=589873 RepID=A0A350NZ41_9ALTE|nr:hypothetical protein [Alteromonas australica]